MKFAPALRWQGRHSAAWANHGCGFASSCNSPRPSAIAAFMPCVVSAIANPHRLYHHLAMTAHLKTKTAWAPLSPKREHHLPFEGTPIEGRSMVLHHKRKPMSSRRKYENSRGAPLRRSGAFLARPLWTPSPLSSTGSSWAPRHFPSRCVPFMTPRCTPPVTTSRARKPSIATSIIKLLTSAVAHRSVSRTPESPSQTAWIRRQGGGLKSMKGP